MTEKSAAGPVLRRRSCRCCWQYRLECHFYDRYRFDRCLSFFKCDVVRVQSTWSSRIGSVCCIVNSSSRCFWWNCYILCIIIFSWWNRYFRSWSLYYVKALILIYFKVYKCLCTNCRCANLVTVSFKCYNLCVVSRIPNCCCVFACILVVIYCCWAISCCNNVSLFLRLTVSYC